MATTCIHTLEPVEFGGVPSKLREVAELHTRFGHEVKLLYTATEQVPTNGYGAMLKYFWRARPRWETNQGYRGFAIPHWPLPLWATYALPLFWARSLIDRSQMQVIVSGANQCGLPVALLRKKYIIWIGTLYEEELAGKAAIGDRWAQRILNSPARNILAWEEKLIFERAALILTNGGHTAEAVKRTYPAAADRVRVLIYPVDTAVFHPDPAARSQTPVRPYPYLLFTARINDPRKNMNVLFRAFARVRTRYPDLRLVLTGDAPEPFVRRALEESGVQDAVEFVGYQSREMLVKLYQGAELFVLPSSQEGLCISMLEALACGLPVVSTRCGGPESVIVDGQTGLLVENGNPDALAAGIFRLLDHPGELNAMRRQSAEYAQHNFAKDFVDQQLLDAFRTVYAEHFPQ